MPPRCHLGSNDAATDSLPADVQTWLRDAFGSCNEQVSAVVLRVPTNHETALDMSFIDYFAPIGTPVQFPSGWVVQISTHYLDGGRHVGDWPGLPRRWESADIGVLVLFRQHGRLIRSKVALLQSKRLYPGSTPTNWRATRTARLIT